MKPTDFQEQKRKILLGLEKSYQKLLEDKRKINGEIVIMKDNKIAIIKP